MNLRTSQTGSSSCQCTTTLNGKQKETKKDVNTIHRQARKFPRGHRSFLEPGSEKKWCGIYTDKPDGSWDRMAENMMMNFSGSSHPIFRVSSAFERGELRSKGGDKKSIHFNGSEENIELLFRTMISANQLSVYGAIADLCKNYPKIQKARGNLKHLIIWRRWKFLLTHTNEQQQRILMQDYEQIFEQLSDDQKLSKLCSDAGLKLVEQGQYFKTLDTVEGQEMQHLCREYTMSEDEKGTRVRGWIRNKTRIGPV